MSDFDEVRSRSKSPKRSTDEWSRDRMTISDSDAAFVLGKGGKTKEKIARVSKERVPFMRDDSPIWPNLPKFASANFDFCAHPPRYCELDLSERDHEAVLEIRGTDMDRRKAQKYIKYSARALFRGCESRQDCTLHGNMLGLILSTKLRSPFSLRTSLACTFIRPHEAALSLLIVIPIRRRRRGPCTRSEVRNAAFLSETVFYISLLY